MKIGTMENYVRQQISAPFVSSCVCTNDLSFKMCVCVLGGQESTQLSRPLLLLLSSYENAVKARSSLKHLNMVRFKYL